MCARACHMCACNCDVCVMCLIVQVFSFFIVNIKKKLEHDFLIFSLPDTHLAVNQDTKQSTRQMCSPSCYD